MQTEGEDCVRFRARIRTRLWDSEYDKSQRQGSSVAGRLRVRVKGRVSGAVEVMVWGRAAKKASLTGRVKAMARAAGATSDEGSALPAR